MKNKTISKTKRRGTWFSKTPPACLLYNNLSPFVFLFQFRRSPWKCSLNSNTLNMHSSKICKFCYSHMYLSSVLIIRVIFSWTLFSYFTMFFGSWISELVKQLGTLTLLNCYILLNVKISLAVISFTTILTSV